MLKETSNAFYEINGLSWMDTSNKYIELHGILVRSLLMGSWFSRLFINADNQKQVVNYRSPWLDIKQGISELQTLQLLQEQLANLQHDESKLMTWLNVKIENLLQAMDQSRLIALKGTPYWEE
jgi:triphosphatase